MIDHTHYKDLQPLDGFVSPVCASQDLIAPAQQIARRYTQAYHFLSAVLPVMPDIGLVVLSEHDWARYAAVPTFGITHYDYPHHAVVTAAQPSTFWHPIAERINTYAPALHDQLRSVYGQPNGDIDLTPNIDQWVVHDLGHAFHLAVPYWFPRRWLMEYFADLCAYSYLASNEPERLPALMTLYRVFRAIDAHHFQYNTLTAFEAQYDGGDWSLDNYLWYHGSLFSGAEAAYRAVGTQALQRLWQTFVSANVQEVSDRQLLDLLAEAQPELARVVAAWPQVQR
jgi:hypothetical protein